MSETTTTTTTAMNADSAILDRVGDILVSTLGLEDRRADLTPDTPLLGELPELDSLGVVELASALEAGFGIVIDDDDFTAELFATVASLAAHVADQVAGQVADQAADQV